MKCPHCLVEFHKHEQAQNIGSGDRDGNWVLITQTCPSCLRYILEFEVIATREARAMLTGGQGSPTSKRIPAYPQTVSRRPCPQEVPADLAEDYTEACVVLPYSAKASAALSRRCLQHLLREYGRFKAGSLADEIQQAIDSGNLPSYLVESIDAIRNIGNFSAHPIKSTNSGEVLPVEPEEAEWTLDVLESLFDFYFVQAELLKAKRQTLNQKLHESGKSDMK